MAVPRETFAVLVEGDENHRYFTQSRGGAYFSYLAECVRQVLGDNAAEADKLFAGEPETALIAAILWAFEVGRGLCVLFLVGVLFFTHRSYCLSICRFHVGWGALFLDFY